MAGIAIGHGKELDGMSKGHELRGCSTELKLAVIRMCPDAENPELKIWHARQYSDGIAGLSSSKRLHRCSVHHRTYLLSVCYGCLESDRETGCDLILLRTGGESVENRIHPARVPDFRNDANSKSIRQLHADAGHNTVGIRMRGRSGCVGATTKHAAGVRKVG
jgi:hypothetical protein